MTLRIRLSLDSTANGTAWIGSVTLSDTMPTSTGNTIAGVKAIAKSLSGTDAGVGSFVTLANKVFTYNYDDSFYYIQEPDRSQGIRVNPDSAAGYGVPLVPAACNCYG